MKKILIYHTFTGFGGIENQIVNVVKALSDNYEFYFASTTNIRLLKELRLLKVNILPTWSNGILKECCHIARFIKNNDIEIIQVHTFSDAIKIRIVKLFCPQVKIVFRVHTYIACSWIPNYKKKLYYLIDSLTSFAIKRYVVNGKYMMQEFRSNTFIPKNKLRYMLDGITEVGTYAQLTHYNTPIEVLMIANVIPHKGHEVLVKAVSILKQKGYKLNVKVLGDYERDADYYNQIKSLIGKLDVKDEILYLGFDKEIDKHLSNTNIVVLPSDSEGSPNCIMEGMSKGRIAICTDTGALREMIEDGISGFLCKPQDPEDFAFVLEKAIKLKDCEIADMSDNGYKKWLSTMSIAAMKSNLLNIYNEIR